MDKPATTPTVCQENRWLYRKLRLNSRFRLMSVLIQGSFTGGIKKVNFIASNFFHGFNARRVN
jgi:hypothetical protein